MDKIGPEPQATKPEIPDPHYYRGEHCHWQPTEDDLKRDGAVAHVMQGWSPQEPFISKNQTICCFGSCDAEKMIWALESAGYKVGNTKNKVVQHGSYPHVTSHGDGMASIFTVLQQFQWIYENRTFEEDVWYYSKKEEAATKNEEIKQESKALFDQTDVFVFTLALSEIWYDIPTGAIFWRAIPQYKFNKDRHAFRVATCSETIKAMKDVIDLIHTYIPQSKIIFCISPTTLSATFRNIGCITANSASKAILRAAIDEVMRSRSDDQKLFYFPYYELALDVIKDPFWPDRKHLKPEHIANIMGVFKQYYCK